MSHAHRDDHELVDIDLHDGPQVEHAPPAPVVSNADAQRAAEKARGRDVTPDVAPERSFRADGGNEDPRLGLPLAAPEDEDASRPSPGWTVSGPPAPRWEERYEGLQWFSTYRFSLVGFDDRGGASWIRRARAGASEIIRGGPRWV